MAGLERAGERPETAKEFEAYGGAHYSRERGKLARTTKLR